MVIGPDCYEELKPKDFDAADELLRAAFPTDDEARLVRRLRADGDMWTEFVTFWGGTIGAYAALSRMRAPEGWACLGPVAVRPEFQNGALAERNPKMTVGASDEERFRKPWRFGSRIVEMIVDCVRLIPADSGFPQSLVVLGKPSFYERCGFGLRPYFRTV